MRLFEWFSRLSSRERWILIGGSALSVLLLFYMLVWEPLAKAHHQLHHIVETQKQALQWMQQSAIEIQQLQRKPMVELRPLSTVINESLSTGMLADLNKRVEHQDMDTVKIHFTQVRFTDLIPWLGQLYNQHAIFVSQAQIERLAETDTVKVSLSLRR